MGTSMILKDVESFAYLGSVIAKDGGTDKDIKTRTGKARSAFLTLKPIWRSKVISQPTKLHIFNSNVWLRPYYSMAAKRGK